MKFYYVLCQGGLWGNVPGFTLQGYRDKKDFKPEMTVEMKRAGRVSVWHKHSSEGGSWKVTRKIPGGEETASEASWNSTAEPGGLSGRQCPPSCPLPFPALSPNGQKRAAESGLDMYGPTRTQMSASMSASQLCALTLAEESVRVIDEKTGLQ